MIQDMPSHIDFSEALHDINLQGNQSTNWCSMHHEYKLHYYHQQEHVIGVGVDSDVEVISGYDKWYSNIRFHTGIIGSHYYSVILCSLIKYAFQSIYF